MSDHAWTQDHIAAYVAGGLDSAEAERFDAHVAACPPCTTALADARRTDAALAGLFAAVRPGPTLEDRLLKSLRETPKAEPRGQFVWKLGGWKKKLAAGLAATLVLGTTGAVMSQLAADGLPFPGMSDFEVPIRLVEGGWDDTGRNGLAREAEDWDRSDAFKGHGVVDSEYAPAASEASGKRQPPPASGLTNRWDEVTTWSADGRTSRPALNYYERGKLRDEPKPILSAATRGLEPNTIPAVDDKLQQKDIDLTKEKYNVPLSGDGGAVARMDDLSKFVQNGVTPDEATKKALAELEQAQQQGQQLRQGETELKSRLAVPTDQPAVRPAAPTALPAVTPAVVTPPASNFSFFVPAPTVPPASGEGKEMGDNKPKAGAERDTRDIAETTREKGDQGGASREPDAQKADPKTEGAPKPGEPGKGEPKPEPKAIPGADGQPAPGTGTGATQPKVEAPRKIIIRSGDVEYEIESFDAASVAITKLTQPIPGAYVATVNSEKLPNGKVKGVIVVRTPPEHLDAFMLGLRAELTKNGTDELKGQKVGSSDITKMYTDMESRLKAARAMETRLLKMIQEGKGDIKQLLEAERELGVWRTKIEELEGELRYYGNLAALSTLTITLVEREIRAAAVITESEVVQAGVEVEDVDQAFREATKAIFDAKGRITKSELKQLTGGQYNATLHFEVAPEQSGPLRDRLRQLGRVARLEINRVLNAEGTPPKGMLPKRGDTQFYVQLYNLANVALYIRMIPLVDAPEIHPQEEARIGTRRILDAILRRP